MCGHQPGTRFVRSPNDCHGGLTFGRSASQSRSLTTPGVASPRRERPSKNVYWTRYSRARVGQNGNKRTFPLCPQRFRTWPPVDTQKAILILKGSAPRSEQHGIFLQNVTFNPTWICRDSIVVAVTRPAEGAGAPEVVNARGAGIPKPAWLKRLKNSARNCKFHRSVKRVALKRERSNDRYPGPINMFRPAFP